MQTTRLLLRSFTPSDGDALYEYLSQSETVRYEPYDVYTREQALCEAARRANDPSFFAVCLRESGKLIGNLYLGERMYGEKELGYVFNRRYCKQGYATEAARALMHHAFSVLNARRVVAECNPDNTDSWRLLERLSLRREAHFRQNIWFTRTEKGDPVWQDTYVYALLRDEWFALTGRQ